MDIPFSPWGTELIACLELYNYTHTLPWVIWEIAHLCIEGT